MSYRHILLPYKSPSSRKTCPSCGEKRQLAPYVDTLTGELLPDHVGRCNRELKCGYHYSAKQYFADNGENRPIQQKEFKPAIQKEKPVDYLNLELVEKSLAAYNKNNFFIYLSSLLGEAVAYDLCRKYLIGTSKHWSGANVFWQVDSKERVRAGKIMLYNPVIGKRIRDPFDHINWVHTALKKPDFNLKQCFFGEHLLLEYPSFEVGLVESEKSAVICAAHFPDMIWIASGGKYGCRWYDKEVARVLTGRKVTLYPDADSFGKWNDKAAELSKNVNADVVVSDYFENHTTQEQKAKGVDIAEI